MWGREASATAPPAPRPTVDRREPEEGRPRRSRSRALVLGAVLATVIVAAGIVVLTTDGPPPDDDAGAASTTTEVVTRPGVLGEPAWTAPVACRPAPDAGNAPVCPVALDDDHAFVLVDREGTAAVEARSVGDGSVVWARPFPEGAAAVRRLPATLLVLGVGPDWLTVSLDPHTGDERWRAPGTFVGPIGRDHVLLDGLVSADIEERGVEEVRESTTGEVVLAPEGTPASLYVHPCDAAGLALVRQDGVLRAHAVADGAERWSVPVAERLDFDRRVHCDDRTVAYVDRGILRLHDAVTGVEIGATTVSPGTDEGTVGVLAVASGTVVVGSSDGARGFRADAGLEQLWRLRCRVCGSTFPVGAAGDDDLVVVIGGQAVVPRGDDGASGPRLDLEGRTQVELAPGSLLAWGAAGVVLADTADLAGPRRLEVGDVRQAVADATHLVVTTQDEVRVYPLDS